MSFFEQQKQRKDKQFISIFDSVYFVSEHGKGTLQEAFELVTSPFLRKQTYLLLITPHSVKAVYVCSSYEQSTCEPYITFESIIYELKECIDRKSIGTGNPIYKLGFGKKSFVEQLLNLGMQLPEQIIFNTESPDITHAEHENEGDEWAFYQGLPKEYDTLRTDNEKLKAQYQELWNKKQLPEAFYEIKRNILEKDAKEFMECQNRLDKSLLEVKSLNEHCTYLEQSLEQSKRQAELAKQLTEKRILELESQLAQAKAGSLEKPADSIIHSNTDIYNSKQEAIKQFNRSLAKALIELDYKDKLIKEDIAKYIMPYMKELAFMLADEDEKRADSLTVSYGTLCDEHLKNLGFKKGRQSNNDKNKVNIDLLFKKQLPVTE